MPRDSRHESSILHDGPRNSIELEVLTSDAANVEVNCSVCQRQFTIPRSSLAKERQRARDIHCRPASGSSSSAMLAESAALSTPSGSPSTNSLTGHVNSVVVAAGGDGKRYLKHLSVDDVILSVHRRSSDDGSNTPMVFAKMVDQTERLMGIEVPQAMGYPHVAMRQGSQHSMDSALSLIHKEYTKLKAYEKKKAQFRLEEDKEWKSRVEAFNLLCDPNRCPDPSQFTSANMDKCIDMLIEDIPWDFENGVIDEEGQMISCTPRLGTHLPQSYRWTREENQQCILDFDRPGPEKHLPVLVQVLCADCRTDRKECVFQLRSGEHVKVWVQLDDCTKKIYPQLGALLQREISKTQLAKRVVETERRDGRLHTHVYFLEPPLPPPEHIAPDTSVPLLTNESVCEMLKDNGCVGGFAATGAFMAPAQSADDERRLELKAAILESKADETLFLLCIVSRKQGLNEPLLTPAINELREYTVEALEKHTAKLLQALNSYPLLQCKPRPLPSFEAATVEELESYVECNSLHRQIVHLLTNDSIHGGAPKTLNTMGVEQLQAYWAQLTD
jgi:hypothetical protein